MSDYQQVKEALAAGTPPELVCGTCPWDRLCITPPSTTPGEIERKIAEAQRQDQQRADEDPSGNRMPVGTLLTAMLFAGKDLTAQICPVFSLKLRAPEGRQIADGIRAQMRGDES